MEVGVWRWVHGRTSGSLGTYHLCSYAQWTISCVPTILPPGFYMGVGWGGWGEGAPKAPPPRTHTQNSPKSLLPIMAAVVRYIH